MRVGVRSFLTLILSGALLNFSIVPLSGAQQAATVVPTLVRYSGTLTDLNGKPLSGTVGVTFLLYKDDQGGAPLWMETQNITPDKNGHYTAVLGSTTAQGLPTDLFASGEARWLGVQAQGQAEQPRVLLLSVPYALKAGDAQTVGGLPASAFVLAAPGGNAAPATSAPDNAAANSASAASPLTTSNVTTSGGTANTIPMFTTGTNIQNSILTQAGTTAVNVGGKLNLPATGTATSTAGFNSRPQDFVASVFNSGTKTAVQQTFQLQAEPAGNNTSSASGTLNVLYATGTGTPAETGLKINSKGIFTFAAGQTFPGTGTITGITTANGSGLTGGGTAGTLSLKLLSTCATNQILKWSGTAWACAADANSGGTVTSVASGAGLTGGPITSSGTLSIATGGVSNAMLAHPSVTVKAGTDLTGGGTVALGGTTTLNLDTTKVPTLSATTNTFTGSITAVNLSMSGSGYVAGDINTPANLVADYYDQNSGGQSPGVGFGFNGASISSKQTAGGNQYGMDFWTNYGDRMSITQNGYVGVGTTQPYTELHLVQSNSGGLGPSITLMNNGGGAGSGASVDFDGYDPGSNTPTVRIQSIDDGISSSSLVFYTKNPGSASNPLTEQMRLSDYGSLIVDSSSLNSLAFGSGSAAGNGLIFGGTSSGEGIASCRSSASACLDTYGYQHQYGLEFYTGYGRRMSIWNTGDMEVWGCTYWFNGDHQGTCLSDARLKTNIQPFPNVLEKLAQLEPVHFDWKSTNPPELHLGGGRQTGFVAQQAEKIFPEMVSMGEDGYRRVNYGELPYLLLQGVRELKTSDDSLHAEGKSLRKQNEQARAEIAKLRRAAAATDARVARLSRSAVAKDAKIAVLSREIEELRKTQQQMAVLLARFAPASDGNGKSQPAKARPAVKSQPAGVGEIARAQY
jgi:hypothetical protein